MRIGSTSCASLALLALLGSCNRDSAPPPPEQVAVQTKSELESLIDSFVDDPESQELQTAIVERLRRLVQTDLASRDWSSAADRIALAEKLFPPADKEHPTMSLRAQVKSAIAAELDAIDSALKGAPDETQYEAMARFESIPEDYIDDGDEKYEQCRNTFVQILASRLEKAINSVHPKDRIGMQELLASADAVAAQASALSSEKVRDSVMSRVTEARKKLSQLANAPQRRAARAYNLKALELLRIALDKYDKNTSIWNDKEDKLAEMLVTELGQVDPRYLDPPTTLIYNEVLYKTMEQLDVGEKLDVVERLTKADKLAVEDFLE